MSVKVEELANPHIRTLEPYQGGRPIEDVEREFGLERVIKLASNESPLPPSERVVAAIRRAVAEVNRYPDGSSFALRRALAERLEVAPDWLFLGAGSDEILEVLAKAFLRPGDEVVFAWPGFAMYPIVTRGAGARAVPVPLDAELRVDVDRLVCAVGERTRLLILANPNNPTGTSIGDLEQRELLSRVPERVVVICDEAYLEYVRRGDFPRTQTALRERETLIQLRTFSKIYGLAGLRVGFAVAQPALIGILERARHPFNVNHLAQVGALAALEDRDHVTRVRELTHLGLAQLERGLEKLGLRFAASDANFLLVRLEQDAREVGDRLMKRGVIARPLDGFGLPDCLRVTAGLPEENARLLAELALAVGE